jgi:predicted CXXCH cytochrome family protein
MAIALATGCGTERNFKVLSFFFDGVPPPSSSGVTDGDVFSKDSKTVVSDTKGSVHGPYGAKMCYGCHAPSTNALILPVEELCANCHKIQMDKKWIHGPLVSGGCRICHLPHKSANKFLLVSDAKDFCFYCHTKSDVAKNPAHEGAGLLCTSCHDPHMSDIQYLLR